MSTRRLLLVEDEPALASLLERFLTRGGFEVVCCGTGAAALAAWNQTFAGAVLDLGLPDVAGEVVLAGMLDQWSAPVVVSSGTPVDQSRFGELAQWVHVLQKPYLPNTLLQLVERLVPKGEDSETATSG